MEINKKSSYKSISIMLKNDPNKFSVNPGESNSMGIGGKTGNSIQSG
jgi:hypothetical protein